MKYQKLKKVVLVTAVAYFTATFLGQQMPPSVRRKHHPPVCNCS
jgi:hypothetical protein